MEVVQHHRPAAATRRRGPHLLAGLLAPLLPVLLAVTCQQISAAAAAVAAGWKSCSFNAWTIGCRDSHSPDGTVWILWQYGKAMTYRLVKQGFPFSTLRDTLGGLWQRELLIQGNAVLAWCRCADGTTPATDRGHVPPGGPHPCPRGPRPGPPGEPSVRAGTRRSA